MRALRAAAAAALGVALACVLSADAGRAEEGAPATDTTAMTAKMRSAVVGVRITRQGYDTTEPWKKRFVRTSTLRGVMVQPHTVLIPGRSVKDSLEIEVTVANSARRYAAKLKHHDSDLGLALVEIVDPGLRETLKPIPLGKPVRLDDTFEIYQLGQDNMVERYTATVARASAYATSLALRCKTTLSDSGNGQACIKDGALVGIVTSTNRSRQEASVLSLETIRHYLNDFDDGRFDGLPGPGPWTYGLLRDDLRAFHHVAEDQHGVVISRTAEGRTGHGVLEAGDVLLELDGRDIDDEGMFMHPIHGRLNMWYLMRGKRYKGDTISAKVLRKGEVVTLDIPLQQRPPETEFVPERASGERPQFLVVGGLVILEYNSDSGVGRGDGGIIIRRMRDRADWDRASVDPDNVRRRIVYVDHVLRDPANQGYDNVYQQAIRSVNGKRIAEIGDVAQALTQPLTQGERAYHVFRFEGLTSDVVLPAEGMDEINARIAKNYKVTKLRHLSEE